MRIAIWHNLPSGGGKRALYDQVKGLKNFGFEIESWCPSTADVEFLSLKNLIQEHVLTIEWPKNLGKKSRWDLSYDSRLRMQQMETMINHCKQCADEINRQKFDLLIAHSCQFFATSSIGVFVNIPKILYLQEPKRQLYEAMPFLPWEPPINRSSRKFSIYQFRKSTMDYFNIRSLREQVKQERIYAAAFDMILVNSFYSREAVLRAYGLDSLVCYLGIDTGKFVNLNLERQNYLIGVGSFTQSKNIEFVIRSIALLPSPRPSLIWVGNMPQKKYIEKLENLANSLNVDFTPRILISDEELVKLYNQARVMVYSPRLEPFGFTPLEANACGTPVVAVAEGGVRETVVNGKNGFLVENSEQTMADAIQTLLDQPELAISLGKMGRKWVEEKWTLEASLQRLINRINEVITEKT